MSGFLCSMVGASFTVAAAAEVIRKKTSIISLSSTAVSTTQSKFGGSSAYFNGTTGRIDIPHQSQLSLADYSNWTIECWYRFDEPTARTVLNKDGIAGTYYPGYTFYTNASKQIIFGVGGSAGNWITITRSTALSSTTWYHLAAVKSGSTVTFYVDGVSAGTATWVGYTDQGRSLYLGWENNGTYGYGYMDELRISKTARYTSGFTPSTTPFVNDDNTVLLIHANGTDGSTFFEDDNGVRAPKSVIAYGNAQVDTAQSKFGGSSALFDGTGDYLNCDSGFSFTGDFTIEFFVRFAAVGASSRGLATDRPPTSAGYTSTNWYIEKNTSDGLYAGISGYGDIISANNLVTTGVWYHIAFVRSGSSVRLYLDGTERGTALTYSGTVGDGDISFGAIVGLYLNGWMDEIRVSNSARYTANFTAPTQPFVNDTNTVLLIHCDGTDAATVFRDDNGLIPFSTRTAKTLTAQGNAQVDTAQYKFGSSALLCDGTGDYVLSTGNSDYNFGTSSFTIEFWIRFNVAPTLYVPIALRPGAGIGNGEWWCEITNAEKKMYWGFKNQAGTQYYVNLALAGTAFTTGVWYHIALVNNAGTAQMYVDGVATGTTTSLAGSFGNSTTDLWVGAGAGAYSVNGWMDEVRISKTARYTANFTPSTAPFNSDSNTVLLMHMEGTDASTTFTDDVNGVRTQKGIQALGNAQIDTAQSKFGGSSALFDGTGDYLRVYELPAIGTGDFTVEFWFRPNYSSSPNMLLWDNRGSVSTSTGANLINFIGASPVVNYWVAGSYRITGTTVLSSGTWYHIAVSRSGTSTKLFINGTQDGSTYTDSNSYVSNPGQYIGQAYDGGASVNGHIDEFRISYSARYTANFTAPTAPFQNDANTVLLLHMDGTDASTVFFDDNGRDTTPT